MGADLYIKDIFKENLNKYEKDFNKYVKIRNGLSEESKGHKKAQKKVTYFYDKMYSIGYFRDCYNDYGLFNFINSNTDMDLSWWVLAEKKGWFKNSVMVEPDKIKEFLNLILKAQEKLKQKKTFVINRYGWNESTNTIFTEDKEKLKQKEVKYYFSWLKDLIKFLKTAINLKKPIEWSV